MEKQLTVYALSDHNYKDVPAIVLKGKWLRKIGFEEHNKVKVFYQNDCIVITKYEKHIV